MTTQPTPFFRPAAVAAQTSQPVGPIILAQPVPMRVAACVSAGLTVALGLLLTCGHYTRKVHVGGQLVPAAGSVKVVAPQFGRSTRPLVADDADVTAGQPLFELNAERTSSTGSVDVQINNSLATRRSERAQTRQLQTEELTQRAEALAVRRRSIAAEIATRRQELILQAAQVQNAREKLQRYSTLAKKGFVSPAQLNDVRAELNAQQARSKALEGNVLSIERDLLTVQEEARGIDGKIKLIASQAKQDLAGLEQEAAEHDGRSRHLVLAPVAGKVTALTVEAGQSVSAGAPLATIIPAGSALEARLMVPSRGVGFIQRGQQVLLRVDAFPYQKFGQVAGVVARVERGPISEGMDAAGTPAALYRVTVRLSPYGQQLKAGMTLEADILQDRRRLVEWMIDPLVSAAKGRAN